MAPAPEPWIPLLDCPAPADDVVFHGHAGGGHTSPDAGAKLVTIETPAGRPTGVLHHVVPPTGFSWGYRASGPP